MKNFKFYPNRLILSLFMFVFIPYLIAHVVEIHIPTGEEIAKEYGKVSEEKEAAYIMDTAEWEQNKWKKKTKDEEKTNKK